MIPRLKPAIGWNEFKALLSKTSANDIEAFECSFASLAHQKQAVAFPYGRTAMVAILNALGLKDAEILCPSYTCVVVPHAIVTSGNIPVFIDPNLEDFNMSLDLIDGAITTKTRAIVATSLFGYPVNLDLVAEIRKRYPELVVIQDCAHSFFCEWDGRFVNKEGICAFYGLNISKIMTSIFGGMVTTDDEEFAGKLRIARSQMLGSADFGKSVRRLLYILAVYVAFTRPVYGFVNRLERLGLLNHFVKYYDASVIDMPEDYLSQMVPIEARVGMAQCIKYDAIVAHRRKLAKIYMDGLAQIQGLRLPPSNKGATYSHFVLRSDFAQKIKEYALDHGVQLGGLVDYYIPDMDSYRNCECHGSGTGRELPQQVVNLPVHMATSEQDAYRIIQYVKDVIHMYQPQV